MALIVFFLILSFLVLVHEFGHFLVAKKNGIRVEEFGLGYPPMLFGKKFGETLYSFNLLPFGGFVRLTGEDVIEGENEDELIKDPRSFISKKPSQRAAVLSAGVLMHLLLAVVLFYTFLLLNGFKTFRIPLVFDYHFQFGETSEIGTVISDMSDNSPAKEAGVTFGDAIVKINGVEVHNALDVRENLKGKYDQEVDLLLVDLSEPVAASEGNYRNVKVKPILDDSGNPVLGVYLSKAVILSYEKPLEKLFSGFLHTYNFLSYSIFSLGKVIGFSVQTHDVSPLSQSVAGPVGIYNIVGSILSYKTGSVWLNILDYVALMSLSLAFVNILPLPALDGGRLAFTIFEWVTGKKPNPTFESAVHRIGFLLLLALLILVTIKDIL